MTANPAKSLLSIDSPPIWAVVLRLLEKMRSLSIFEIPARYPTHSDQIRSVDSGDFCVNRLDRRFRRRERAVQSVLEVGFDFLADARLDRCPRCVVEQVCIAQQPFESIERIATLPRFKFIFWHVPWGVCIR